MEEKQIKPGIDDILSSISNKLTPEYFEKLHRQSYEEDRIYPENFSNWYPYILDFGEFKHSEIIENRILTFEEYDELTKDIDEVDFTKIKSILEPTINKMKPHKMYSLKNGCFSNKFDFDTSVVTKNDLVQKLYDVFYASSMFETGGNTEIVLREYIPYNKDTTPTIYNGMPLRTEVRVFYNMDTNQIEYIVDYWDYDYCAQHLSNATDRIIFNYFHNMLGNNAISHKDEYIEVCDKIKQNINTLKFDTTKLTGVWSIDFMYVKETQSIYLIDMARGYRSAYWNMDKLALETKQKLLKEFRG